MHSVMEKKVYALSEVSKMSKKLIRYAIACARSEFGLTYDCPCRPAASKSELVAYYRNLVSIYGV